VGSVPVRGVAQWADMKTNLPIVDLQTFVDLVKFTRKLAATAPLKDILGMFLLPPLLILYSAALMSPLLRPVLTRPAQALSVTLASMSYRSSRSPRS
jgi:hypothetical protein